MAVGRKIEDEREALRCLRAMDRGDLSAGEYLYLFLDERRRLAKALWFDGSGWCLLARRLEAGSFQLPPFDGDKPQVVIDGSAFASLLAGIDFTAARRGWYRRPRPEKVDKTIDTDRRM